MTDYLLAYHGGQMPESADDRAVVMAAWGSWYSGLGPAVTDGGNPVGRARTIATDGSITDGGGPNPVSGYTMLTAGDLDDAVRKAEGCPILSIGGTVEVCEMTSAM